MARSRYSQSADHSPNGAGGGGAQVDIGTVGINFLDLPRGLLQTWDTGSMRLEHFVAFPTSTFSFPSLCSRGFQVTRITDVDLELVTTGSYGLIHPNLLEIAAFMLGQPTTALDYYTAKYDATFAQVQPEQKYTATSYFLRTGLQRIGTTQEWNVSEFRKQGAQPQMAGDKYTINLDNNATEPGTGAIIKSNGTVKKIQGPNIP